MRNIRFIEALREGLAEEMRRDPRVFQIGESLGKEQGGMFKVTEGLDKEFGPDRVIDSPLSEAALGGVAVGAAIFGMRPVVEIMFGSLMPLVLDEVHNQAGTMHYVSGGKVNVPMVIRTCNWVRIVSGPHHCGNFDAAFVNSPGVKVVVPSTPYDVKGLIKAAIRDSDPVVFMEYSPLYQVRGDVPEEEYLLPIGKADIKREGTDVSVITYGTGVHDALAAAAALQMEGVSVEVLDLRTINPYDKEAIKKSVMKTGRAIVAYEGFKTGGAGAEFAAFIGEECIEYLSAPIIRVACKDVPNPSNARLITGISMGEKDIADAIRKAML
ncbi:MAG: pyruvate dehydrogenase complex E1 component subunit beta [Clostridiales bacterium]|nr:pyruvate dehydrogenase complex E1 component subunit beta [Clostridiales bacterium]